GTPPPEFLKVLPALLIAIPLGAAFLVPIVHKIWKRLAEILTGIAVAATLGLSIYLVLNLAEPVVYQFSAGNWEFIQNAVPLGIIFVVDKLAAFMLLVVSILVFFSYLFATKYMDHFTGQGKFYTLYLLMFVGMNGVVMTGDLFNMFVFMEIAAISSYALVAFGTEPEELEAGFKYMVMGEIASLMILLAIAFIYASTRTLNMADLSNAFAVMQTQMASGGSFQTGFYFVLVLLVFGFALKAALAPFISWLPDAHPSAPAPISSLLSGVLIKVLGAYALARVIFNVYGFVRGGAGDPWVFNALIILGTASIAVGGLLALVQKGYKRLLADSSLSQIGYIVLGFGIGNMFAVVGALAHILAHALGKGLLFLTSGSVEYRTGEKDINKLPNGLGKQMPWTSLSYNLGALSVAGMPPFIGFFSKMFIILGALQAANLFTPNPVKPGMIVIALIAGIFAVVTLGYLLKITNSVFWGKGGMKGLKEAPFVMVFSMICLVALLLVGGVTFAWLYPNLFQPAAEALLKGVKYAEIVLPKLSIVAGAGG
ncbi:NADH/ubiquinone/plastoquinone (complex I), partial [candidate division WOR-3 bacterium]|nr:NADH/ubiquinone/plastoquinone (complex I) [candidate division WOR-3 bacterium]MBD3364240.1 NADH/ubiquinone/plastoquinone (complex I) [candidate division WOR-3 bacterium]